MNDDAKDRPLRLLIEHSKRLRDEAARHQAGARQDAERATQTLKVLGDYRDERQTRMREHMAQHATTVDALRLHARFAQRLDDAIAQQDERVAHTGRRLDEARESTLARQRQLKAIEHVLQQCQDVRRQQAVRAERRALDELATQRAVRARTGRDR